MLVTQVNDRIVIVADQTDVDRDSSVTLDKHKIYIKDGHLIIDYENRKRIWVEAGRFDLSTPRTIHLRGLMCTEDPEEIDRVLKKMCLGMFAVIVLACLAVYGIHLIHANWVS